MLSFVFVESRGVLGGNLIVYLVSNFGDINGVFF